MMMAARRAGQTVRSGNVQADQTDDPANRWCGGDGATGGGDHRADDVSRALLAPGPLLDAVFATVSATADRMGPIAGRWAN